MYNFRSSFCFWFLTSEPGGKRHLNMALISFLLLYFVRLGNGHSTGDWNRLWTGFRPHDASEWKRKARVDGLGGGIDCGVLG